MPGAAGQLSHNVPYKPLGVAEEHQGFILVVQRVIDAGEAGVQAPFDHHDGARLVHIEDGYAAAPGYAAVLPTGDFAQERPEPRLREMFIGGECIPDTTRLHYNKGYAVGQTPFLVWTLSIQRHRTLNKRI